MRRLRLLWRRVKQYLVTISIVAIILLITIVLIFLEVRSYGTGFSGKTLWDWLQLLGVLAVPIVVGLGAVWFTAHQGKVSDAENKDNQHEAALQAYIDKISELLLKEHLGERRGNDILELLQGEQVRKIARVQTITVLIQLDAKRIGYVFTFLREAGLMSATSNDNVVSLSSADLRAVKWRHAHLGEANLSGAHLFDSNISRADLRKANLSGAALHRANLSQTDFDEANLSKAGLSGAHLSESWLLYADLHKADLGFADLRGAVLASTDLSEARLTGADLRDAVLCDADLRGADLSEADLRGADLRDANVTTEQLDKANHSKAQLCPMDQYIRSYFLLRQTL